MPDYATIAQFKRWASDQPDYFTDATGDPLDDVIALAIAAASRGVEADTGRVFHLTPNQTRTGHLDDLGALHLVDLVAGSVTLVRYDADGDHVPDTDLSPTDYTLLPPSDERGAPARRHQRLRLCPDGRARPRPGALVEVTGDWGYVDDDGLPPADIVQATVILAARLFVRREAKLGIVTVPSLGTVGMMKGRDPDYMDAIERYIHPNHSGRHAVT